MSASPEPKPVPPDEGVSYAFDEAPPPASAVEVAPGVLWLRMPLPFALDHINLWLLEDAGNWTIVDTGIARDEVRQAWLGLFGGVMRGAPVTRLICTHFHPDHFGLAGWLSETLDAALWMTRTEWLTGSMLYADVDGRAAGAQARLFGSHGLDADRLRALEQRGNAYRRGLTPPPPSFRRIRDGEVIEVGGAEWTVVVGRGHAPEHACLYCAEKNVLISGDQVLPKISPNVSLSALEPGADPLSEYLQSLKRLAQLPAGVLVLPSHDYPFHGLQQRLASLERHHAMRLDRLAEFCRTPRTAAETLELLFRRRLDGHQIMFAMGESLSHLVHLEKSGRVQRQWGNDGVFRFSSNRSRHAWKT